VAVIVGGNHETEANVSRKISPWRRVREIWEELDDAQRRLLEIHTGVPLTARSIRIAEIADLETAFAQGDPDPEQPTATSSGPHSAKGDRSVRARGAHAECRE
jgi:hypothetical protein